MHAWIQTMVDVLIVVMASILVLFTLGLIILHIVTTSNSKRVEQIKKRILRMLSVSQDLEYLRGQIYQLLDPKGEIRSLREIRGIKSNRGAIAMTIVVDEITDSRRELLRNIILQDEWYMEHIRNKLRYAEAAESIRQFTHHPQWSVRSTAATALARISPDSCYEDLLRCLCDREWWVRFHAAEALYKLPGHPDLMSDVQALGDRFAYEMMLYIVERDKLLSQEVVA